MKKTISVIIISAMCMTNFLFTANAAYEEVVMQSLSVVNSDFEAPVIYDASADTSDPFADKKSDTILGWVNNGTSYNTNSLGDNKFTIEPDPINPGNHCLLILDTRISEAGLSTTNVWSDLIPVSAGDNIQAKMDLYLQYEKIGVNESGVSVNSRALYLKIWYFNAAGVFIGSANQYTHDNVDANKNKWVAVTMPSVTTPANTAYIRLNAMCTNAHTTKTYVDNVSIQVKKLKSISNPIYGSDKLYPNDTISIDLNIINTTKTEFPVCAFYALYNNHSELVSLFSANNGTTTAASGTILASVELPADVTGYQLKTFVFKLENGRIVPYYKWVGIDTSGVTN